MKFLKAKKNVKKFHKIVKLPLFIHAKCPRLKLFFRLLTSNSKMSRLLYKFLPFISYNKAIKNERIQPV